MIRFNKYEHKKFLIVVSDFIRKISKGDRLTSISSKVGSLIKKEAANKKKKSYCFRFWMWVNGNIKKDTT